MITLIIKTTDGCNLRCCYCSIGKKNNNFSKINIETLKKIGDFVSKKAKENGEHDVKIILHGGEPTIVNCNVYRNFFEYIINKHKNLKWHFAIQTNGFFISDEYIKLFKDFNVTVGISLDGNDKIHDILRVDKNGKGTFDKVKENILRLTKEGVFVSALIVVTKPLLKEELSYLNFFNYHDVNLKINPVLRYGEAVNEKELWLDEGDYAEYLIKIYKFILENEIEINIEPIANMFNSILNNSPMRECSYSDICGKRIICANYKGDIYPCGRYHDISDGCMGNVNDGNIKEYKKDDLPVECNSCKYLKRCYNGCAAYRKILKSNKTPLCSDIKRLFDYFSDEGICEYINYLKEKKSMLESEVKIMEESDV